MAPCSVAWMAPQLTSLVLRLLTWLRCVGRFPVLDVPPGPVCPCYESVLAKNGCTKSSWKHTRDREQCCETGRRRLLMTCGTRWQLSCIARGPGQQNPEQWSQSIPTLTPAPYQPVSSEPRPLPNLARSPACTVMFVLDTWASHNAALPRQRIAKQALLQPSRPGDDRACLEGQTLDDGHRLCGDSQFLIGGHHHHAGHGLLC